MEELNTIKQLVNSILEVDEQARNSDKYLIWLIFTEYTKSNISFNQFSLCPSFESIRRMRQKLQEENIELRGDEAVGELREKKREEYKNYFKKENESLNLSNPRRKGIEVEHTIKKGIALF